MDIIKCAKCGVALVSGPPLCIHCFSREVKIVPKQPAPPVEER